MTVSNFALDTNILFYAFDSRDSSKHDVANRLLFQSYATHSPVALHVLSEFYQATTSKLLSPAQAQAIVEDLKESLDVVAPIVEDLTLAMSLHQLYRLQFFDCLILAIVTRAGCSVLFSEDMQHQQTYGSVQVINPFRLTDAELSSILVR